jgi:16S rRNA (uracil1498-N3)-methyltransferase
VDGAAHRYAGRILDLDRREIRVQVDGVEELPLWPGRTLWLGAGILRSTRMDVVVEKASELGIARFVPLLLERCVARPADAGTKEDRWHRLAVESLKQSRRARLMEVAPPTDLASFLEEIPAPADLWFGDPDGGSLAEAAGKRGEGPLVLLVGPEGGVAPREEERLRERGGVPIRLGGNRLRAETAGLALVAGALAVLGELGGEGPGPVR